MDLHIDTSVNPIIRLSLKINDRIIIEKEFEAKYRQAEKLLGAVEEMLVKKGISLADLEKIFVAEKGDSFSALRIGVITANSLAFALGIPVNGQKMDENGVGTVIPIYDRVPNITIPKKSVK